MQRRSVLFTMILCVCVCACTLTGCSDPKASAVGTYDIDKEAIKASAQKQIEADKAAGEEVMGADFMLGMIDSMTMTLTLNADDTASIASSMLGMGGETLHGTWALSGSAITLTMKEADGTTEPVTGTVSGNTITLKPPPEQDMPFDMVFKKRAG